MMMTPRFWASALCAGMLCGQPTLAAAAEHDHGGRDAVAQRHSAAHASGIIVEHGYTFPSRPGVPNVGVYFERLQNATDRPDQLLSVDTSISRRAELHEMLMDGEVMRMRQLPRIDLPAGGRVDMAKGSAHHVMLMGLHEPLRAGQVFELTLNFRHAPAQTVRVVVREAGEKAGVRHHGRHGHGHGHDSHEKGH
ncbi:MAG: copper chaperone PCu(A)C [Lautropia sp.]|nr:copper chaperone PCu(A)C [Lautropia sp.]